MKPPVLAFGLACCLAVMEFFLASLFQPSEEVPEWLSAVAILLALAIGVGVFSRIPDSHWKMHRWLMGFALLVMVVVFLPTLKIDQHAGFRAVGNSMSPLIQHGDIVKLEKQDSYHRGDVIAHERKGRRYINRIVALPGDTLEIMDDRVRVNGQVLDEPYVVFVLKDWPYQSLPTVAQRHVYVLPDHRGSIRQPASALSVPSAALRVPDDAILGKVVDSCRPLYLLSGPGLMLVLLGVAWLLVVAGCLLSAGGTRWAVLGSALLVSPFLASAGILAMHWPVLQQGMESAACLLQLRGVPLGL